MAEPDHEFRATEFARQARYRKYYAVCLICSVVTMMGYLLDMRYLKGANQAYKGDSIEFANFLNQTARFGTDASDLVDYVCEESTIVTYKPICLFPYVNEGWISDWDSVEVGNCHVTIAEAMGKRKYDLKCVL